MHHASERIFGSAKVNHCCDTRHSDSNVSETLAPWTTKCVGDDDTHIDTEFCFHNVPDTSSRPVAIKRKKCGVSTFDIGEVDAAVGTDETVFCFGDDEVAAATHDAYCFVFNKFLVRHRIIGINCNKAILGFGNDLLCDDKNVIVTKWAIGLAGTCFNDDVTNLHSWCYLADAFDAPCH